MTDLVLHRAARIELYRRDFQRYCREQVTIAPKIGAHEKLNLWAMQLPIDKVCTRQWKERGFIRVCVFKARQRGGTTYSIARGTWRVYLNPNVSAILISNDDGSTANAFNKARLVYEEMSADIKPVGRYYTKNQIVLEAPVKKTKKATIEPEEPGLRSRLELQTAKNMNAAVGTTRQVVLLSEMPRWTRTEEIRSSLLPTIPDGPGTIVINEATPYGWGKGREEFRDWCDEARSGKSEYELVELFWWMDPTCRRPREKNQRIMKMTAEERYWAKKCKLDDEQILYRRHMVGVLGKTDTELGEMLFKIEFPGDYESAWDAIETPAFDRLKIEQLTRPTVRPPIAVKEFVIGRQGKDIRAQIVDKSDGEFWIWELPQDREEYDIGADCAPPSASPNGDFCAFQVIKRSTKEQVAEWYGHPGIFDYAAMLVEAGKWYNNANLAIEVNGIGYAVNEWCVNEGYDNIYRWRLRQQGKIAFSNLTGWKTQDDSKKLMLAVAYDQIDHNALIIRSERLRGEFRRYMKYYSESGNEKYEASEGHDDGISAFMIAQVVSRDEDALGGAPSRLGNVHMGSLAERNAQIEEFMKNHQPGVSDSAPVTVYGINGARENAWMKLARGLGMRGEDE